MHQLGYVFGMKPELPIVTGIQSDQVQEFYRRAFRHQNGIDDETLAGMGYSEVLGIVGPYEEFLGSKELSNFGAFNADSITNYGFPKAWLDNAEERVLKLTLPEVDK